MWVFRTQASWLWAGSALLGLAAAGIMLLDQVTSESAPEAN
jgi:hypothetical protein